MSHLELPKLPDTRSTQRLLNILGQVEKHLANQTAMTSNDDGVSSQAMDSELGRLRTSNKKLRTTTKHVVERLDSLLSKLSHNASQHDESKAA